MGSRRTGGGSASSAATAGAAALTLAAAGILFLVVRTTAVGMERLPAPGHGLELRLALQAAVQPNAKIGPELLGIARQAALASPLAWEPFYIAARAAEQKGDYAGAIRLMEEARRRRPSYTATRVSLMGYYARVGRYREAIGEADVAMRLNGEAEKAILPILADLLAFPEGRAAVAAVLAQEPVWRARFLEAAKLKAQPQHAADLYTRLRALKGAAGARGEAGLLVAALMRTGRYADAHRAWLELLPAEERQRAGLLYDGDFRGAAAPFNWTFHANGSGRAEPGRQGEAPQLHAAYFGSSKTVLAEQALVLAPGRYRMSVRARADRTQPSGSIYWAVTCLPGNNEIGRLAFPRFASSFANHQAAFDVPAGCGAQTLSLVAEPGDLSQPITADFAQLRIER
jgi:tetratricopeptide (TPR) repeat protein